MKMMNRADSDRIPAEDEGGQAVRQAERRRIAQLIHDSVSQSLTAAYLEALVLARKLDREDSGAAAGVARLAERLHGVVSELREVTRHMSSEAGNPSDPASPPADPEHSEAAF